MDQILTAIAAAPGIAIGKAFWYQDEEVQIVPQKSDPLRERERLEQARNTVRQNIHQVFDSLQDRPNEAAIFTAHEMLLDDPELIKLADSKLDQGAEYAWDNAIRYFANRLEALPNEYLSARAADIRDIGQQVLRVLAGIKTNCLSNLETPVILLARDLTPSVTGRINKNMILGFATQEGSSTSHTAILAKALGLPAVVGVGEALKEIADNDSIIVDGHHGEIIIEPNETIRLKYSEQQTLEWINRNRSLAQAQQPAITTDGCQIEVVANIGSLEDAHAALSNGAEGIGLLRTEFLYMNRKTAPSENEQFKTYQAIFEVMGKRPVVVRTLDIGGDKYPAYMDLGQEANPFLGWRAIRVCLDRPDFFKTQLRAILRTAKGHDVRIMFPMIATIDELRRAKALLLEARGELDVRHEAYATDIQVGIMVEIPSVVQMADIFAREVDFFSIGLTQYTFAVDRTNTRIASIADAAHPAILKQIQRVVKSAHQNNIWVGLCGELAGDPMIVPILLGLELDEFSVSSNSIPMVKEALRRISLEDAKKLAGEALKCESASMVRELVSVKFAA